MGWSRRSRIGLVAAVAVLGLVGVCFATGCGFFLELAGYPPEAMRETPPEGIDDRSPKVGANAPSPLGDKAIELSSTTDPAWSLSPGERYLLVFYRGAW